MLSKQDRLRQLKQRVQGNSQSGVNTEFYFLAKELGCLSDLLGREYEFIKRDGEIVGFRQKPMSIPTFIQLMDEMEKDYRNQEKQMKKSKRGKK